MKKYACALCAAVVLWQAPAMAGEVDILVRILVEKGILTQQDADAVLQETRAAAEVERRETIAATRDALMSGTDAPFQLAEALPAWIKTISLKGDFRLRWQFTDREGGTDRHRGRYRLRLGFVTAINDKVEVGFGFATGDSNPRSTNQNMTNSFETPDIRLDYAYASYRPTDWLRLIGGKFKNPLWLPGGSYLFDSDIRPEGVSAIMQRTAGGIELFITSGFWILDERSNDSNDPAMWVAQPGYKINLGERMYFKNALTLYQFSNIKGTQLDYSSGTNTRDRGGNLVKDYDATLLSGEFGYKTRLVLIPFSAVYGEYINNRKTGSRDSGYALGFKFGHEKVAKKHQWQASAHYHRLERDAWPDVFPDADTYGGQTNVEAYIMRFTYGVMNNIDFTTNYYHSRPLSGRTPSEDNLQLEVNFKF